MSSKLIEQVNKEYHGMLLTSQAGKSAKDQMEALNKEMLAHKFMLKDKPFPTFLKPFFVEEPMREYFLLNKIYLFASPKSTLNL